jgi:flavin reductase (DIM6/NTAB) family NADH-FMN oxidoreductase RutF
MTASWGGMGVLWNKNVVFVFIRDSRFTKEFVDSAECFSLSVFDHQQYKKMLGYMGSVSGRKEDKIAACGLTVEHRTDTKCAGAPYFAEAKKVFICKKMYRAHMPPENFIDPSADAQFYANKDYHNVYIAEILQFSENE